MLSVLLGGREGERSVDVGIFLRAYRAQASCFNFVLCPRLSGVSWLSWGCGARQQPSSLHHTPLKPCSQPAVWFLSWVCVVLPPYTMRALYWAGGEHPSLQEGASVHMLTSRFAAKSCLGALLPSPNPYVCKGLAACSWGQPGLQLEPGGSRASERELQTSLASCVGCFMYPGQSCCLYTHLVSHLEQLWSWMLPSGGEVGLGISAVFRCADRLVMSGSLL